MATCKLDPVSTASCDWNATPGEVTLRIDAMNGLVAFEPKSTYSGGPITFDGDSPNQITFTIVLGTSELDIVYVFSDTSNGAGTLHEDCDNNTVLDDLSADEPARRYIICA